MKKVLVDYFSASGITAGIAEKLAKITGGDLYKICPEVPYTAQDLDWRDPESRSSVEMKDKSFRPAIKGSMENIEQYDVIYLGFPIWWYVAPTIINTFLESYDLQEKIVVPFATSGSSGMGNTNAELRKSCPGAVLKEGKRFSSSAGEREIKEWIRNLEL